MSKIVTLVFIGVAIIYGCIGYPDIPEEALQKTLFQKYNKNARPATRIIPLVNVDHSMGLIRINDFRRGILKSDVYLAMEWQDPRLTWDPSNYFGLRSFSISHELLWTPDVTLYNGVGDIQKSDLSRRIMVKYDGMAFWMYPSQLETTCTTSEQGEHVCRMTFGSWTYDGLHLNLTHSNMQMDLSNYYPNPDWEITSTNSMRNVTWYPCCPEPYPEVSYQLSFKRAVTG